MEEKGYFLLEHRVAY